MYGKVNYERPILKYNNIVDLSSSQFDIGLSNFTVENFDTGSYIFNNGPKCFQGKLKKKKKKA